MAEHHRRGAHHQRRRRGCSSASGACGVAALGLLAPATPRLAQLGFLVVVGFLLVNKVYSPQYVLWLLPLAVMARPRWRDQLIWQAGEIFYFAAVWWYLGSYLDPGGGGDAGFYWLAISIRVAAQLYLVAIVVRDILMPEHDVVRTHRPAWARPLVLATDRAGAVDAGPDPAEARSTRRGSPPRSRRTHRRTWSSSRSSRPGPSGCWWAVSRLRGTPRERQVYGRGLAWGNLVFGVTSTMHRACSRSRAHHSLPLQICDIAWIFVAWALRT